MKPIDYVWEACPTEGTSHVRGQLGRMLFSGDDVDKAIGSLSGGEAARLIFARIIVEKPNVLILDEPTNHLDLEAIHALAEGLKEFDGTVLFVSHDRWFVSEVATRILELTPTGPRDFPGTFAEYLERCGDDHLDADAVASKAKAKEARAAGDRAAAGDKGRASNGAAERAPSREQPTLSWEEQKKRRNRLNALPGRRDKVLAAIDEAEARKKAIAARYAEPGFFQRSGKDEIDALEREDKEIATKIERWVAEWGEIEKELALLA
jgi:ABC-type multidrug transport system ATPase subunit